MPSRQLLAGCLGLATLLGGSACSTTDPATEVIVVVRADDVVTRAASRLTVMVKGFAAGSDVPTTMQDTAFAPPGFPRRIAIVPAADDASRTFSIEVRALAIPAAGGELLLSTARVRAGFLAHRTTEVSLLLVAGCSCPERQTCNAQGRCVDDMMMVDFDAGVPSDAGDRSDAGSDAAMPVSCTGTSACDDLDPCTSGDTCAAGVCRGAPMRCDDGDECNGTETCAGGVCQPGLPMVCDDSVPCTTDTCERGSGCRHQPVDAMCTMGAGGRCDAVTGCSYPSGCSTGGCPPVACATATCNGDVCSYSPLCNDDNPCTRDDCAAGVCNFVPITGSCDDGNRCTTVDRCVSGACRGTILDCGIVEPCRIGVCDSETGMCAAVNVSEGARCTSFDNLCVLSSECRSGECQALTVMSTCTDGSTCSPMTGCP